MKITSILSILALVASTPLAFALPEPIPEALAAADPEPLPQQGNGGGTAAGPTCRRPQDEKAGTRCSNRGKRTCNCAQDAILTCNGTVWRKSDDCGQQTCRFNGGPQCGRGA